MARYMGSTLLIITLFLLVTIITPETHAFPEIKSGTSLKYEIFIYNKGNETLITKTYEILSIRQTEGKTNITWKSGTEQGYWIGESFGNPVVLHGEKWTTTNIAFYSTVSNYKSHLSLKKTLHRSEAYYNFRMKFVYFTIFKGLPRYGKTYEFIGYVKAPENKIYYKLIHNITYFANGVAYKIFYEESEDIDYDLTINENERYYEIWQLIDWNLPWYSAISPLIKLLVTLIILIFVIIAIKYIIKKYTPKIYGSEGQTSA